MGFGLVRQGLVQRINDAFHPNQVAGSARRVAHLGPNADAFDIVHELGLFQFPPGQTLGAYRASLPIPEVHHQVLKSAFQSAVQNHKPLTFGIVSGGAEGVHVSETDSHIHVVLTRKD
jgi:hypothetical protein